jgi:hypothetical protein
MRVTIEEAIELIDPRLVIRRGFQLQPQPHAIDHETLEDVMRVFLRKVADRRPPAKGQTYGCMEAALLDFALPVYASLYNMQMADLPPGRCFENAFAVSQSGGWLYAEGYAVMDGSAEPVHHAWLVGPYGVEDPTWQQIYRRKTEVPGKVWSGNVVYFGVTISPEKHAEWTHLTGYPNLLSVYDDDVPQILTGRMPWL